MSIMNLWKKGKSYYHSKVVVKSYPTIHSIEPTNACGMRCKMCPRQHMTRSIGFMDIELFKKIVSQIKYQKIITLHHFGDPLLHPKMGEMIDIVHKQGLECAFSTNPQSLTPANTQMILDAGLDRLHISLDGATKETYEAIRGGSADYGAAVKSVKAFLKAKLNRGIGASDYAASSSIDDIHPMPSMPAVLPKGPYVIMAIIKMNETEKEIEEFKRQWTIAGVDEVQVKPFIKWDGTDDKINAMGKNRKKDTNYPCWWPWSRLVVLWDGRVVPCCYDYDGQYVLGDLNHFTIDEIWNGFMIKQLRASQIDKLPFGMCINCHEKEGSPSSKWFPFNLILKGKFDFKSYFKFN